jgi:uncharacterized protein (TIGR03086 family)
MNDPRATYAQALDQTETVIAQVRADQAGQPTPCADWDVRKLVTHMVGGVIRVALVGEGADALSVPPFADLDSGQPAQWAAAYRAAAGRAAAAWADDAKLDVVYALPWGTVPGRVAVAGYVREVLAHGWDLAAATGQETELDQELGTFALELSQRSLPAEGREGFPFGPVVPVDPGAGVYARLAAWLGREPAGVS